MQFKEEQPNTKLLVPDSERYLKSAAEGLSSDNTKVSIYKKNKEEPFKYNHSVNINSIRNEVEIEQEKITSLVLHSLLNGRKISSNFDFMSCIYMATTSPGISLMGT